MPISSSIISWCKSTSPNLKPLPRSAQALSWNPISIFAFSNSKDGKINLWSKDTRQLQFDGKNKRNSSTIYANTVPGDPLPSNPPPSGSIKSWLLGMIMSVILPFFTNKWGPLWVLKNRIENAVQTVENVVECVEKVAEGVDKVAEDIGHDLPQGKLKQLVEFVEQAAEKTANTADSLDDMIDKVQEAEEKVESIVESIAKDVKNVPPTKL